MTLVITDRSHNSHQVLATQSAVMF